MFRLLIFFLVLSPLASAVTPDGFATSAPPNGTVYDVAQQSNGSIIAVGAFTKAGTSSRSRIARYTVSGALDTSFFPGSGANGVIRKLLVTDGDEIVIGGDFTSYQGNAAKNLALLNSDGSFKKSLNLPASTTTIYALAYTSGRIYVGGDFPGGLKVFNLLGGYLLPTPSGLPNGPVYAICIDDIASGPFVTFGGDFTKIGSTDVGYIAHFDRNQSLLSPSSSSGANAPVRALDLLPGATSSRPGIIAIAGDFTTFNGLSRNRLAAIYGGNPQFSHIYGSLGAPGTPSIQGSIHAIQIQSTQLLAIGGEFTVTSKSYTNLVFAGLSGGFGIGNQSDHRPNQAVHGFTEQADGMLVIGGEFTLIDGLTRKNLTRLYGPGGSNPPNAPTLEMVYPMDDDSIFVSWKATTSTYFDHYRIERKTLSGSWQLAATLPRDRLRFFDRGLRSNTYYSYRVLATSGTGSGASSSSSTYTKSPPVGGTAEPRFDTSTHNNSTIGPIGRIAVDARQRVLAAEDLAPLSGQARKLHRLLPDGSIDPNFSVTTDARVMALNALPDGKILLGGNFQQINEQSHPHLARLLSDGSIDLGFTPRIDAPITSILPLPDGGCLISGSFTKVNGQPREKIDRLHPNGSLNSSFIFPSDGFSINSISHLQQADDQSIYLSASITPDGSSRQSKIFKVDANGYPDTSFALPADLVIDSLTHFKLGPDGKLYLAGDLWPNPKPNDFLSTRLVRLNANGSLDSSFSSDGYAPAVENGGHAGIFSLIIPADHKAIIGGSFRRFDARPRFGIARHKPNGGLDHSYTGGSGPQGIAPWHPEGFYHLQIYDFASLPDGRIVAAGNFSGINGVQRQRIAALHSGPYTATAAAPTNLSATAQGNEQLSISWNPVAGMTGYLIERRLDGEVTWSEIARIPASWHRYVDTLNQGTTASYRLRGISGNALSSNRSNIATATATSPFRVWLESYNLPGNSNPEDDLDFDGLTLLHEYSLQRSPKGFDRSPWYTALNSDSLIVATPMSDIIYTIQTSNNLSGWSDRESDIGSPASVLTLPLDPGTSSNHYFRLKVEALSQ